MSGFLIDQEIRSEGRLLANQEVGHNLQPGFVTGLEAISMLCHRTDCQIFLLRIFSSQNRSIDTKYVLLANENRFGVLYSGEPPT